MNRRIDRIEPYIGLWSTDQGNWGYLELYIKYILIYSFYRYVINIKVNPIFVNLNIPLYIT